MTAFARQQRRRYYNAIAYARRKRKPQLEQEQAWDIDKWDADNPQVNELLLNKRKELL
jgi:hypothetical protein